MFSIGNVLFLTTNNYLLILCFLFNVNGSLSAGTGFLALLVWSVLVEAELQALIGLTCIACIGTLDEKLHGLLFVLFFGTLMGVLLFE